MANSFSLVGVLRPMKNGLEEKYYDSGWMSERLRFRVVAGDNSHFVEINAGRWKDESKNTIYSYSKGDGNKKGEPIQIPWNKRNDPATIEGVAGWKVMTVDLDTFGHRKEVEESGDEEAIEASHKKRHHFIAGTDFCEYVNKVVNSEKIREMKFRVNGNINYTYSAKNGRYYETYEVTKIYRVDDSVAESSEVTVDFYYTEDAFDDSSYEESGKAIVSGFTPFYDSMTKKNWFCPINLAVRDEKKVAGFKKLFSKFDDEEVRRIVLTCAKIDGAQRVDIKLEDLSEEVQDNVAMGLISEEDAIRDAGGQMAGDRVQEMRIEKLGRGFSAGSETTVYTIDDLKKPPMKEEVKVEDDEIDLFSDDFDDEL